VLFGGDCLHQLNPRQTYIHKSDIMCGAIFDVCWRRIKGGKHLDSWEDWKREMSLWITALVAIQGSILVWIAGWNALDLHVHLTQWCNDPQRNGVFIAAGIV
jgi:hypothetical protein